MKLKVLTASLLFIIGFSQLPAQGLGDLSFGTDSTLELVTWNIEWFPKRGANTIDSVKKIIEALDVEIIALQEISDTSAFRQLVNGIPDYEFLKPSGFTGGLAYVYKSSSITVQSIYKIYDSSSNRNFFPRPPQVLEFSYQGESYIAINNHLKCCGNGTLDFGNTSDEEFRRLGASDQLKQYVEYNFFNDKVIILGDLNDLLTDPPQNNVFRVFIDDSTNYKFADMPIAQGASGNWSFPNWPSHLDHILVTGELFPDLNRSGSVTETIRVDDYISGGFSSYDFYISDHRPVGMKLNVTAGTVGFEENNQLDINIYPNPTIGELTVQLDKNTNVSRLEVLDVLGKVVKQIDTFQGDVKFTLTEPAGIYFIRVQSQEGVVIKRIIKT